MKKLLLCIVFLIAISGCQDEVSIPTSPADQIEKPKDKTNKIVVCHYTDDGTSIPIEINLSALPDRLAAGDYLPDADGDGYSAIGACIGSMDDCDDNNPAIKPGAEEVCGDGVDNNCNGEIDEGCSSCSSTVTYEGKTYNTMQIGDQCWMKENLDIGTMINGDQEQNDNSTIEKYCYDNDPANCETYGALYQWDEAMQYVTTEGAQGICPTGWHIPTMTEYEVLAAFVNYDGNALKAIGQGLYAGAGTNTSGFSALLAGRRNYDGTFEDLGIDARFWSSTEYNIDYANFLYLVFGVSYVEYLYDNAKVYGFNVRCLKD